tara:strand:+ start:395 stop:616 length:222 start_codon:yes stop_codon:yes gene_type:complete
MEAAVLVLDPAPDPVDHDPEWVDLYLDHDPDLPESYLHLLHLEGFHHKRNLHLQRHCILPIETFQATNLRVCN